MITDFGLAAARQRDADIYMYTPCGTPEYIAPEVVTRRPYTCSVDMWAVGVMTFIMLSGTFPFENSSRLRLYKLIMRAKFSFEAEVGNILCFVLCSMFNLLFFVQSTNIALSVLFSVFILCTLLFCFTILCFVFSCLPCFIRADTLHLLFNILFCSLRLSPVLYSYRG